VRRNPRWPLERPIIIPALRVEVRGDEIVVTACDTHYIAVYRKPTNTSQLRVKSSSRKEDRRVSMALAELLTDSWKPANDKARELGWIV
jgi:hypothetical protein